AAWMLPFLWAGMTLTVRRAVDAGWPAWCAVLFFVPYVSYVLIAALCLKPTHPTIDRAIEPESGRSSFGRAALSAISAGALFGVAVSVAALRITQTYGLALLFLTPFMMGAITGFVLKRRYDADGADTTWVTFGTFVVAGLAMFFASLEGAACLLMS